MKRKTCFPFAFCSLIRTSARPLDFVAFYQRDERIKTKIAVFVLYCSHLFVPLHPQTILYSIEMPEISVRGLEMPESPIRKLAPLAAAAKKRGTKVYHLNIGQPDLPTPQVGLDALKEIDREILEYSPSQGYQSYREKLVGYYAKYIINRYDKYDWNKSLQSNIFNRE